MTVKSVQSIVEKRKQKYYGYLPLQDREEGFHSVCSMYRGATVRVP